MTDCERHRLNQLAYPWSYFLDQLGVMMEPAKFEGVIGAKIVDIARYGKGADSVLTITLDNETKLLISRPPYEQDVWLKHQVEVKKVETRVLLS